MSVEEVLKAVEQVLLSRPLSPVERLVLRQSWLGQSYSDIAENSPYGSAHIKEVGSRLWHDLSILRYSLENISWHMNEH